MESLKAYLEELVQKKEMVLQAILSNPREKEKGSKIKIRPMLLKGERMYQAESFIGTKAFHENFSMDMLASYVVEKMEDNFKQLEMDTETEKVTALISKKGKVTVKRKKKEKKEEINQDKMQHNKVKQYVLPTDVPVPFLVDLGVQTADGKIVKAHYDKFKQINRYLEFVRDILPSLPKNRTLNIIDFGCGKSYLTFALYYFLTEVHQYDIRVIGLDLKEDVIAKCNALSKKYGYDRLSFYVGDISTFDGVDEVDMVVTLRACDVATDYALEKAVKWNAKVIFSVPCCQHELNKQMSCELLEPVFKYGLIKERMAALLTDAYRANLLEEFGYDTQILEFIDMEHTPKNILIRAVKRTGMAYKPGESSKSKKTREELGELAEFLHIQPTLQTLLDCHKEE